MQAPFAEPEPPSKSAHPDSGGAVDAADRAPTRSMHASFAVMQCAGYSDSSCLPTKSQRSRLWVHHFREVFLAVGFIVSRTQSMKSFTTGVSVRFFNVAIPTGQGSTDRFTGRTLRRGILAPTRTSEAGRAPKRFPLESRAQIREAAPDTVPFGGNFTPRVRNASATSDPMLE